MGHELEVVVRTEDPLPEVSLPVGLLDRGPPAGERIREFAAEVVEHQMAADRHRGDHHPLEDEVRIVLEEPAVLEGARLRFVGVAEQVARLRGVPRDEGPLRSGREAGAAPSAKTRLLHLVDDRLRAHAERLPDRAVAARGLIRFQDVALPRPVEPALHEDLRRAHGPDSPAAPDGAGTAARGNMAWYASVPGRSWITGSTSSGSGVRPRSSSRSASTLSGVRCS